MVYSGSVLVGMCGLVDIQWENSIAEISLIIDPKQQKRGMGYSAVELVLDEAFNRMGLKTVFGECYECNPAICFWKKITQKYNGYGTALLNRKLWNGKLYDSLYFSIDSDSTIQSS